MTFRQTTFRQATFRFDKIVSTSKKILLTTFRKRQNGKSYIEKTTSCLVLFLFYTKKKKHLNNFWTINNIFLVAERFRNDIFVSLSNFFGTSYVQLFVCLYVCLLLLLQTRSQITTKNTRREDRTGDLRTRGSDGMPARQPGSKLPRNTQRFESDSRSSLGKRRKGFLLSIVLSSRQARFK